LLRLGSRSFDQLRALKITVSGTADGFTLNGPIQAANSSVRCIPLGQDMTQVFINGFLKNGTQVGIELDAKSGTFGPGGTAGGSLTLDLFPKPPKVDHAAGAGTGPLVRDPAPSPSMARAAVRSMPRSTTASKYPAPGPATVRAASQRAKTAQGMPITARQVCSWSGSSLRHRA
jgi:hypothetical protein